LSPVIVIPPMLRTYLHVAVVGMMSGRSLRTVKSSSDLPEGGKIGKEGKYLRLSAMLCLGEYISLF
jgi:hypothetical protein